MEKTYNVLNQTRGRVIVSTQADVYRLPPMTGMDAPGVPLSLDEILYINSRTQHFKNGTLTFEEDCKAALYEECRIRQWEDILTAERIREILRTGSSPEVQALISDQNELVFERIKSEFTQMKMDGELFPGQIEACIHMRNAELASGMRKTKINVQFHRNVPVGVTEDEAALRAQILELQRQLDARGTDSPAGDSMPKQSYICPHCGTAYARKGNLDAHVASKHPVE
jgi:hypothetical protein